jgi:hypothetical protein
MNDALKHEIIDLTVEAVEKAYKMGLTAGVKAEREACAKVCEDKNTLLAWPTYAAAIRARGQA